MAFDINTLDDEGLRQRIKDLGDELSGGETDEGGEEMGMQMRGDSGDVGEHGELQGYLNEALELQRQRQQEAESSEQPAELVEPPKKPEIRPGGMGSMK